MFFKTQNHNYDLYNTLLGLSRNIFFYKDLNLPDVFETRINLVFFHFSLMMIICKKKDHIFSQESYDNLFLCLENDLREQGLGDVSVNTKMKDLNKILYDILLKIEVKDEKNKELKMNSIIIIKYFSSLNDQKSEKFVKFERYFKNFYKFCFELSIKNMIKDASKFIN